MTPDDIKAAAGNLNDLERIPQIIKDIETGSPITITVGDSNLNIQPLQASKIREAITAYLSGIASKAQAQLAALGVGQDDFEKTLAQLDAEAQPNGVPN
jgi:hypothetical protein